MNIALSDSDIPDVRIEELHFRELEINNISRQTKIFVYSKKPDFSKKSDSYEIFMPENLWNLTYPFCVILYYHEAKNFGANLPCILFFSNSAFAMS